MKRAAECMRLAEAEERDPELKAYLTELAAAWALAAEETTRSKMLRAFSGTSLPGGFSSGRV